MKKNKKLAKEQNDSNRLILDDILNTADPEMKRFMASAIKEEVSKVITGTPKEGVEAIEQGAAEATERATIRMAWRFKDKLSPRMQRILEEQYPDPDVA